MKRGLLWVGMKPNRLLIPVVSVLAILVIVAPAEARPKPTERARIHALERQVDRLTRDLALMRKHLDLVDDAAATALNAVQCTYALPFLWKPESESFHPLGIDEVTDSTMWLMFSSSGPDCTGAVIPT